MGVVTERLQLLVTASAKGVASEIKGVEDASGGAATKTSLLQQGMDKLGVSGMNTGTALKVAGATAGAFAATKLVEFVGDGVEKFASLTSEVRGFNRVAGTSAEDGSKLVFAVKEMGIAPDAAASAFGRLATKIGTGKAPLLENLGLVQRNKDGTVDLAGTLANLSEKYQSTGDAGQKAALGNAAFGKSWQTMAPLLGKGKQDLLDLYAEAAKDHQMFGDADLKAGFEYTKAMTQLKDAVTGVEVEIGKEAIPTVTAFAQALTETVHVVDYTKGHLGDFKGVIDGLIPGMDGAGPAAVGMFGKIANSARDSVDPFHSFTDAFHGLSDIIGGGSDSSNKFTDAQDKQSKAMQTASELAAQGKTNTKEYRDAVAEAKSASDDLAGATKKVADSLETEAQKAADATTATLGLLDAHLRAEGSVLAVADAQDAYNRAQYDALAAGGADANANRQVEEASIAVAQSIEAAAIAHGKEVEAASKSTDANVRHQEGLKATAAAIVFLSGGLDEHTKAHLQPYLDKLNAIPPDKHTTVHLHHEEAIGMAAQVEEAFARIPRTVEITVIAKKAGDAWEAIAW